MANYHFIGMCGKAMGTLAVMLKSQGHNITGSDEGFYEPMLSYLTNHGIQFNTGHKKENIPNDVDYIVIGRHAKLVPESNEEVAYAFANYKDKIKSLPEVIDTLTKNKDNIICVGSFGKSSVTTLVSYILNKSNINPSYFIGAVPIDLPDSGVLTESNIFVLEGDEYPSSNWDDSAKFLHYNPKSVILTSCEHDHINVYPTLDSYLKPFINLLKLIPDDGLLVYANDGANINKVLKNVENDKAIKFRMVSYSFSAQGQSFNKEGLSLGHTHYYADNIVYEEITSFDLYKNNTCITNIKTKLLGKHNIENIVGCCAIVLENGLVSSNNISQIIQEFNGVSGRLDKKTSDNAESLANKIPIIESYGSSYAKARADIDAIKLHYSNKKIIVIFEPHTFGWRNRENLNWYNDIFLDVDMVYLLNPPLHGSSTHAQLSGEEILKQIKNSCVNTVLVNTNNDVTTDIKNHIDKDSLILLITSGSILGLRETLPEMKIVFD